MTEIKKDCSHCNLTRFVQPDGKVVCKNGDDADWVRSSILANKVLGYHTNPGKEEATDKCDNKEKFTPKKS
jgi:hypothetical protein